MAQLDVYRNPNPKSRHEVPWLIDLQTPLLSELGTRMVAPLVRPGTLGKSPITRLNPQFRIEGEVVVMLTQQLGAVRAATLKKPVANLEMHRPAILEAIDILWSGV